MKYDRIMINNKIYMSANQIAEAAIQLGIDIPTDGNGQRHPGTLFNSIIKSMSLTIRKQLGIVSGSVAVVYADYCREFTDKLIYEQIISSSSIKDGKFDLYTLPTARVIIKWLGNLSDPVLIKDRYTLVYTGYAKLVPKILEVNKSEAPSLIGKAVVPKKFRVIDQFTEEEQDVIRRYQQLVKETRKDGSRKVYKRS